jgi:hypothetical protein
MIYNRMVSTRYGAAFFKSFYLLHFAQFDLFDSVSAMSIFAADNSLVADMSRGKNTDNHELLSVFFLQKFVLAPAIEPIKHHHTFALIKVLVGFKSCSFSKHRFAFLFSHVFSYASFIQYIVQSAFFNFLKYHIAKVDDGVAFGSQVVSTGTLAATWHANKSDNLLSIHYLHPNVWHYVPLGKWKYLKMSILKLWLKRRRSVKL